MSHKLLDVKLAALNINENVQNWIRNYLNGRTQSVVLNNVASSPITVSSGVPQGSVLGPLLFLIYINDIVELITSPIKLFADDCVIYREITTEDDIDTLQTDLDKVAIWCKKWNMNLNIKKCSSVSFSKKLSKFQQRYNINGTLIDVQSEYKYLGVYFTESLTWHKQIDTVIAKASRMLHFIRRNFKQATREVKETLYFLHVRTILDYACVIWDPYQDYLINRLEKLQNQAARFVCNNYSPYSSISEMKATLGWDLLHMRRQKLRLKLLHRIYNNQTGINRYNYLLEPDYISSRCDNNKKISAYNCRTNTFYYSFFPKTIRQWNSLSNHIVNVSNNELFYSML